MSHKMIAVERAIAVEDPYGTLAIPAAFLPAQTYYYLAVTRAANGTTSFSKAGVDANNTILISGMTRDVKISSEHSLYMCLDQRVSISLSSHLPMLSNLVVREGLQTNDRNICEVFFDNEISSTVEFDDEGVFAKQQLSNKVYCGQFPMIRKDTVYKEWQKLLFSFNLRFFRFHVFTTYRAYDSVKDVWRFVTEALKVDNDKYYDFTLRFLSEV